MWLDLFRIKPVIFLLLLSNSLFFSVAFGDGLASETLPPAVIGNKNVTLSIGSSPFLIDNTHAGTQINFALLDVDTQENIPQATLAISAFKGNESLFGHIFKSDSGNFLLDLIPQQSGNVSISEQGGLLSGIAGQHSGSYNISGPVFNSGGLYRFKIEVLTMGSYDNQVSKSYNAAISLPVTYIYDIYDKQYGKQNVTLIAFYDQLKNFHYDSEKKTMSFVMPFDWSDANLKQATVVHQEIKIPNSFGNFIVTKYDAYVNGVKLDEKTISIDDYSFDDSRVLHLILYKQELLNVAKKQNQSKPEMDFSLAPSNETNFPIVQFTRNTQYKVSLSWDPPKIMPGTTAKFSFQFLDPYLINKTLGSISYDFSVIEGENSVIGQQSGIASSDGSANTVDVPFPSNYTGPITIAFENINGSSFSDAEFSGVVTNPSTVPEFPHISLLVLISIIGFSIMLTKMKLFGNNWYRKLF